MQAVNVSSRNFQTVPLELDCKGQLLRASDLTNGHAWIMAESLPVLLEPGKNRFHGLGSGQRIDHFPVSQQHHDRNAVHGEASRQGRIIRGVYLDHCCPAGNSLGYCSHRRCE